jgi:hypothetical protein
VIKTSKIRRKTVHLRPAAPASRIRRDPALADTRENLRRNAWWESREWEIRLAVIGVTFFALAICAVVIDLGEVLSH